MTQTHINEKREAMEMKADLRIGTPCSEQHRETVKKRLDFIVRNREEFGSLLDIGCGKGIYIALISSKAKLCIGMDIERDNLIESRKMNINNINTDFLRSVSERLPFADASFDTVLMIEVLEHVNNDRYSLKEIYRVLKRGGELIISVPNKAFPFETHAIIINDMKADCPMGIGVPLFPFLPDKIRNKYATARVYSDSKLESELRFSGFSVLELDFLMPNLDGFNGRPIFAKMMHLVKSILNRLESTWMKRYGSTIIIKARKT